MDDITASIIVQCQTSGAAQSINKLKFAASMLTREIIKFGNASVQEFRTAQDAAWRFDKVFRDQLGTADKLAEKFSKEYGLARHTAKGLLADTAGLLWNIMNTR